MQALRCRPERNLGNAGGPAKRGPTDSERQRRSQYFRHRYSLTIEWQDPMLGFSQADQVFVLTGAGISAETGIPTFRDAGGLWRNYRFEEVASPQAWQRDPRLVWEFYSMRRRVASAAKPNEAHRALARLDTTLKNRLFLCTQNVDDLHEQAGSE